MSIDADKVRIQSLVGSMRESVSVLRALAELTEDQFLDDIHKVGSAKYAFVTAIEAAIDIANHLISRNRMRALFIDRQ